jgi:hypothetical protein
MIRFFIKLFCKIGDGLTRNKYQLVFGWHYEWGRDFRNRQNNFWDNHVGLQNFLYLITILAVIVAGFAFACFLIALVVNVTVEPTCHAVSENFAPHNYRNTLTEGCLIEVEPGIFFPYKQIMYYFGEGAKLLPK